MCSGGNNFKVDIITYLVVKIKGGGVKNYSKKRYVIVERPHILRYYKYRPGIFQLVVILLFWCRPTLYNRDPVVVIQPGCCGMGRQGVGEVLSYHVFLSSSGMYCLTI